MTINGYNKIKEIAQNFKLPDWWVESVIVEYFDCRRFAESGSEQIWTFDFTLLKDDDIKKIPEKKVIIPNYFLIQNVNPKEIAVRTALASIGLPFVPLDEADLTPEGLVNNTCFPFFGNPIEVWDHKLGFNYKAIVRDNNIFYQWTISENKILPGKHYQWYKSDFLELDELFSINEKFKELRNSEDRKNPNDVFRKKVEKAYEDLEMARNKIRCKILEYHNKQKINFDPADANVPKPPLLSYFESVKLTENGYQVKTHMEPLFLRSAIRNLQRADTARQKRNSDSEDYDSLLDEIEYSTLCIISATNCLETYINYVIMKHLPLESKIFQRASHSQKWLWVHAALNLSFKFKPDEPPFQDFLNLIKWRNNVIHHKAEYRKASGNISHTFNQFNLENAKLSIKVVKEMVTKLSEGKIIPLPRWIETNMGSASYWDEVSDYLKKI